MGAFLVICYGFSAEEAWAPFKELTTTITPFVDAGEEPSAFEVNVIDCLRGLARAISLGWYVFPKFDYKLYEHCHKLDNGDMNWIIPKKILAFSSPTTNRADGLPPQYFIEIFRKKNVTAVIRLNEMMYEESVFEDAGIRVYNLEFLDGSCPDDVRSLVA